jgi:phosphoglycolate phosphatase-like HAD superfamily hydrolase
VVGGDQTERIKPAPDPVRLCLERLGCPPTTGLMVGDHSNDILAGRAAGLKTCGVLWGFDAGEAVRSAGPDFLCAEPADLTGLLFQK